MIPMMRRYNATIRVDPIIWFDDAPATFVSKAFVSIQVHIYHLLELNIPCVSYK